MPTQNHEIKERPILFSGEMVKAIIAGNKTQTRRIVKPQPTGTISIKCGFVENYAGKMVFGFCNENLCWPCPYGRPGDKLWVRETWATSVACDDRPPSDMEKPGRGYGWPVWYAADGVVNTRRADPVPQGGIKFTTMGKCRPSIFMPRWASRITLEISDIRVERLQTISDDDCIAEGCMGDEVDGADQPLPIMCYKSIWEGINGQNSWVENPWVWVILFRKI